MDGKFLFLGFQKKELRALDEVIRSFFFNFESNMLPKFSGASACSQAPWIFSFAMEVFSVLCAWRGFTSGCLNNLSGEVTQKRWTRCGKNSTLQESNTKKVTCHTKRPLTWKLDCVFLDTKFYGHLNVGIFPDIPIGTRRVFPVLSKNMSLKAHGGCSMLSLFFFKRMSHLSFCSCLLPPCVI